MVRPRPLSALLVACAALGAGGLGACDIVLGIEPWSTEPGEGEGGATVSSSAEGGAGGATRSSSAAEGGTSCDGTLCGDPAECVDVAIDARHCGACGHSCFADGGCVAGVCGVVELAAESGARFITTTDDHVVWSLGPSALRSVAKRTHAPGPDADGLLLNALRGSTTHVYFGEPVDGNGNGRVHVFDPLTATSRVICDGPRAQVSNLVAEGAAVFLAPGGGAGEAGVYRCTASASGGEPSPVCVTTSGSAPREPTLVDDYVVSRVDGSGVVLCSKAGTGGNPTTLTGITTFAVAGTTDHFYFTEPLAGGDPIMRRAHASIVSFDSEELVLTTTVDVLELAAGGGWLAWRSGDRVQAARAQVPTEVALDVAASNVVDVEVDADGVYWVLATGSVMAFAFPP